MSAEDIIVYGILAATGLVVVAAFLAKLYLLWTLSRCLQLVHPRNRTLAPALVWLELVPLFNWVWGFVLVKRVNDSLANEYNDRKWGYIDDDYGKSYGNMAATMPFLVLIIGVIGATIATAFGVMYYRKMNRFCLELLAAGDADYSDYDGDDRE